MCLTWTILPIDFQAYLRNTLGSLRSDFLSGWAKLFARVLTAPGILVVDGGKCLEAALARCEVDSGRWWT